MAEDINIIKSHFPEFKPAAGMNAGKGVSSRFKGISIEKLKEQLTAMIPIDAVAIDKLIEKLDRKHPSQVQWNEFQNYCQNEGLRRETVNDAQMYGFSVKRLAIPPKRYDLYVPLSVNEVVIDYQIDSMCYINFQHMKLCLCFLENNTARLFDLNKKFKKIQELTFPAHDAALKDLKEKLKEKQIKDKTTYNGDASQYSNFTSKPSILDNNRSVVSAQGPRRTIKNPKSLDPSQRCLLESIAEEPHATTMMDRRKKTQSSAMQILEAKKKQFESNHNRSSSAAVDTRASLKQKSQLTDSFRTSSRALDQHQVKTQLVKPAGNGSIVLTNMTKHRTNMQKKPSTYGTDEQSLISASNSATGSIGMKRYQSHTGFKNQAENLQLARQASSKPNLMEEDSEDDNVKTTRTKEWKKGRRQIIRAQRGESQEIIAERGYHKYALKRDKNLMEKAELDKAKSLQAQNVLGLGSIHSSGESLSKAVEKASRGGGDSDPYQLGINVNKQTPLRLSEIEPQLFQQKLANEKIFKEQIQKQTKFLFKYDKAMEAKFARKFQYDVQNMENQLGQKLNEDQKQDLVSQIVAALCYVPRVEMERRLNQVAVRRQELGDYNNQCNIKLGKVKSTQSTANTDTKKISQTNRFYYKMKEEESYPFLENPDYREGNSLNDPRTKSEAQKFLGDDEMETRIKEIAMEHDVENKKKSKTSQSVEQLNKKLDEWKDRHELKDTKTVMVTASNWNEQLGLLAIALIDQEIKIYSIRQSGSQISLQEHCSFRSKHLIGSLYLDKYVMNDKVILTCGSNQGQISMYYIEWDESDPDYSKHCKKANGENYKYHSYVFPSFNFFEKGPKMGFRTGGKIGREPDQTLNKKLKSKGSAYFDDYKLIDDESADFERQSGEAQGRTGISNALMDPVSILKDQYWDLITHTRDRKAGPDGIKVFNSVNRVLNDLYQKSGDNVGQADYDNQVLRLTKELMEMKIKSLDLVQEACEHWQVCVRMSGNNLEGAADSFRVEMKRYMDSIDSKDLFIRSKYYSKVKTVHDRRKSLPSKMQKRPSIVSYSISESNLDSSLEGGQKGKPDAIGHTPNYWKEAKYEKEITGIKYVREIGLIVTTFLGDIRIFDSYNFQLQWHNSNKNRQPEYHATISCMDINSSLGIMVTGGDIGRLMLIDPHAYGILKVQEAHFQIPIMKVQIFAEQQQIISVGKDRTIIVWGCYRLNKIQTIKDDGSNVLLGKMHNKIFTCAQFCPSSGTLWTGCQKMTEWKMEVDTKVEIDALQVSTLSKQILKERNMLELLKLGGSGSNLLANKAGEQKNDSVLISKASYLVTMLVASNKGRARLLISVDSTNLVRAWDLKTQNTIFSYKIPINDRVTAAAIDKDSKYLVVGSSSGEAKVLNLRSGGVIYDLPSHSTELTCMQFIYGGSSLWLAAGSWQGKLLLWTEPTESNNFTVTVTCRVGHFSDIIDIVCSSRFICTGSADGNLSIWNIYSGTLKCAVQMPNPGVKKTDGLGRRLSLQMRNVSQGLKKDARSGDQIRKTVVGLIFHPVFENICFCLTEGGAIHSVDTSIGSIINTTLANVKINSNWAVDTNNMRVLVVGDIGRAALFDCSMGGFDATLQKGQKIINYKKMPNHKWPQVQMWFWAHVINKDSSDYVHSVQFLDDENVFVTATSSGEVKLWASLECISLGTLNSSDWNYKRIESYVTKTQANLDGISRKNQFVKTVKDSLQKKLLMGLKKLRDKRRRICNGETITAESSEEQD